VKGFVQYFLNYGLIAAVLVWAAVVGLMAYHLDESPWRWAFIALAAGGLATVGAIIKLRRYVDGLDKGSHQEHRP
jgi:MFS family permease